MSKFQVTTGQAALHRTTQQFMTVVYGRPGAGKTTFIATATQKYKVLVVDTENSFGKIWESIDPKLKNEDNFAVVNVNTMAEFYDLVNDPIVDQYDILAVDSITHLVSNYLRAVKLASKGKNQFMSVDMRHYGELGSLFNECINVLREKNVSFLASVHEQEEVVEGKVIHRVRTEGKMAAKIINELTDNLIFLDVVDGKRVLYTQPSEEFQVKSRVNAPAKIEEPNVNFPYFASFFPSFEVVYVGKKQIKEVERLVVDAGVKDLKGLLNHLGIEDHEKLTADQYMSLKSFLEQQRDAK